jgi:RNA polymerase sigma-70 factor, ECF subfamily
MMTVEASTGMDRDAASQPHEPSDQDLIAAVNAGDAAAFGTLYHRHRDWVVSLAWRFTQDTHLALDVTQETFLYLLGKFPGFRLTANLRTFLYPAVRHLSLTARRKADRIQSTAQELERIEATPARDDPPRDDELLGAVLAGLPEEHREVLILRFVDGLALGEIAEAMALPLGTVKSRLHYALETLRQNPRTRALFKP